MGWAYTKVSSAHPSGFSHSVRSVMAITDAPNWFWQRGRVNPAQVSEASRTQPRNRLPFRHHNNSLVDGAMPLWNTVMIALVIVSTILFCFWARIRANGGDGQG
jgi:hypothetical protein